MIFLTSEDATLGSTELCLDVFGEHKLISTVNCFGGPITCEETGNLPVISDLPDTLAVPALVEVASSPPEDPRSYYEIVI